ncbi:TIGR02444 family protein [Brevundimonas sp.]
MSLWDWALAAYAKPGVAEACLELQDAGGQNVCLLLWAAWAAGTGQSLDADARADACDIARAWDDAAIAPLRAVRRRLKGRILDMDDPAREAVRAQVKATELLAERHLLAALEAASRPAERPAAPPLTDALAAVCRDWSGTAPRALLTVLSTRLSA